MDGESARLVFKQWIYQPNKKGTPKTVGAMLDYIATRPGVETGSLNLIPLEAEMQLAEKECLPERFIEYIATRPGVIIENGQLHGLFGHLASMKEVGDICDLEGTRKYVEQLAHGKKTIYNAALSLREDDAIAKGMVTRESWARFIDAHINEIAREMNIPPRSLEWVGAVHLEPGHPHLHLMYWDKSQRIGVNWINPQKSNSIRYKLTKELFGEEIRTLHEEKDLAWKEVTESVRGEKGVLKAAENIFRGMNPHDVYQMAKKLSPQETARLLNRRIANRQIAWLQNELQEISHQLRSEYPKGSLKYKYMPESIKKKLMETAQNIIRKNPQIADAYNRYLNATQKNASIFGGEENIKKYTDKASEKILQSISNKLLSSAVELWRIEKDARQFERGAIMQQRAEGKHYQLAMNTLQAILNIAEEQPPYDPRNNFFHSHDLSKAQKMELAKESKDRGLEWGD